MQALVIKEFRELARDRRTLAMLVVLPIVLLIIFGYAANFSVDRISVVVGGSQAQQLAEELDTYEVAREDLEIVQVDPSIDDQAAEGLLRDQEANAVILADPVHDGGGDSVALVDRMRVFVDGSSLFTAQSAQGVFMRLAAADAGERVAEIQAQMEPALSNAHQAQSELARFGAQLQEFQAAVQQAVSSGGELPSMPSPPVGLTLPDIPDISPPTLDSSEVVTVLFNPDLTTSWVMIPGLIGLILLFIGALITSIGLVRERESGTLEQLAVMPLKPSAIILGKITPYFLLAILDMAVVTGLGVWLFDIPFVGSLWLFALAAVIFLFVVLGIGVFISSTSQNTGQAIQMAILFVVPQVLLSGLIFPLESMPLGVRWLGYLLPLTWFREISQGVMLRGAGLDSLWLPLVVLTVMAVVAFGAATARMRYSLTHGGAR